MTQEMLLKERKRIENLKELTQKEETMKKSGIKRPEFKNDELIYWTEDGKDKGTKKVGLASVSICERCGRVCQINGSWVAGANSLDEAIAHAQKKGARFIDGRPQETGWNESFGGGVCETCENELAEAASEPTDREKADHLEAVVVARGRLADAKLRLRGIVKDLELCRFDFLEVEKYATKYECEDLKKSAERLEKAIWKVLQKELSNVSTDVTEMIEEATEEIERIKG